MIEQIKPQSKPGQGTINSIISNSGDSILIYSQRIKGAMKYMRYLYMLRTFIVQISDK
jgi:hypothetical protein